MKKRIFVFGMFWLFCGQVDAVAAPAIQWQKCLGGSGDDEARSIQQTWDGGYIVAGRTSSSDGDVSRNRGNKDFWVVKLNAVGDISWQKCLGGSGDDEASAIQQTWDGGYIVAGRTASSDGDVSGSHGGRDAWVVKLNSTGGLVWQKCLGGSGDDEAYSVRQTLDDGYIVAGRTASRYGDVSDSHGNYDVWVVKLNASGDMSWQRRLGGSGDDCVYSIRQTEEGDYIVAGQTTSSDGDVSGNHGGADAWVVKLNAVGNIVWQRCLGGSGVDDAYSVQKTSDGGYIVAGLTKSSDGDVSGNHGNNGYYADAWVVKLSESGDISWQRCLGGSVDDVANAILQTSDGYIVAGYTKSSDGDVSGKHGNEDFWVVKLNAVGGISWQKCLGGSLKDIAESVWQTLDGGYIVTVYTYSNDGDVSGNHGGEGFWVVKLNADGGIFWQKAEVHWQF